MPEAAAVAATVVATAPVDAEEEEEEEEDESTRAVDILPASSPQSISGDWIAAMCRDVGGVGMWVV